MEWEEEKEKKMRKRSNAKGIELSYKKCVMFDIGNEVWKYENLSGGMKTLNYKVAKYTQIIW